MHGPVNIKQTIYIQRNIESRWHNHFGRGKEISTTYSESNFAALFIQHALCVFGLYGCTIFLHASPVH
jgi:hypothetical protein